MNKSAFCKRICELAEAFPRDTTISAPERLGEKDEPDLPRAWCPFELVVFVEIGSGDWNKGR